MAASPAAPFAHGLVIGKFYPPHAGHHLLVDRAATSCQRVTVVVVVHPHETIPLSRRVAWLTAAHVHQPNVRVIGEVDPHPVDFGDAELWAQHVDVFVAAVARAARADGLDAGAARVDAVLSSEVYGQEMARRLGAVCVAVDVDRAQVPVSGTQVRNDLVTAWPWLHPATRAGLALRVVVPSLLDLEARSPSPGPLSLPAGRSEIGPPVARPASSAGGCDTPPVPPRSSGGVAGGDSAESGLVSGAVAGVVGPGESPGGAAGGDSAELGLVSGAVAGVVGPAASPGGAAGGDSGEFGLVSGGVVGPGESPGGAAGGDSAVLGLVSGAVAGVVGPGESLASPAGSSGGAVGEVGDGDSSGAKEGSDADCVRESADGTTGLVEATSAGTSEERLVERLVAAIAARGGAWTQTVAVQSPVPAMAAYKVAASMAQYRSTGAGNREAAWTDGDFLDLAAEHVAAIEASAAAGGPVVVSASDPFLVGCWGRQVLGPRAPDDDTFAALAATAGAHRSHLYLLRSELAGAWLANEVREAGHEIVVLPAGPPEEELAAALEELDRLVARSWQFADPLVGDPRASLDLAPDEPPS